MLLTLYTTERILTEIIKSEKKGLGNEKFKPWYDLITELKPKLKFFLNENSDYKNSLDNEIYRYIHAKDIDSYVRKDNGYLEDILAMKAGVEMSSSALFILDVDTETARKISSTYGVICHSFNELPEKCPIFQEGVNKYVKEGDTDKDWNNLLLSKYVYPSSSLIFVDRYLFFNDSKNDKHRCHNDAIDNVCAVLKIVLPKSLRREAYHILFIFDQEVKPKDGKGIDSVYKVNRRKFEDVSRDLKKIKDELEKEKNYKIVIEVIALNSIGKNCKDIHEETHNRKILSDYFIIKADKSLKPFRGKKSLCTQSLSFDWAATKGIIRDKDSDSDARNIAGTTKTLYDGIKEFLEKNYDNDTELIFYSQIGKEDKTLEDICNPLLKG